MCAWYLFVYKCTSCIILRCKASIKKCIFNHQFSFATHIFIQASWISSVIQGNGASHKSHQVCMNVILCTKSVTCLRFNSNFHLCNHSVYLDLFSFWVHTKYWKDKGLTQRHDAAMLSTHEYCNDLCSVEFISLAVLRRWQELYLHRVERL